MFRNTYEFTVANEHRLTILSIMETLVELREIRKVDLLCLDNLDIQVTFKANKKELDKVITALNKYGIGKAKVV